MEEKLQKNTTYYDISDWNITKLFRVIEELRLCGYELILIESIQKDLIGFGKYLCVDPNEEIMYFDAIDNSKN